MLNKKFAHVRQQDLTDCGAACVSTLLMQYGYKLKLNTVRSLLHTDIYGTTAMNIIKGLGKVGVQSKPIRLKDNLEDVVNEILFPCIAYVTNESVEHYVVLHGYKNNKLIVSDPLRPKITHELVGEFQEKFTGILLFFNLTEDFHTSITPFLSKDKLIHPQLLKVLSRNKMFLLSTFFLSLIIVLLGIVISYFYRFIVDFALPNRLSDTLTSVSLIFLTIAFSKSLLEFFRGGIVVRISRKIDELLSTEYFSHILSLPIGYLEKRENGDFISRFNDISNIRNVISNTVVTAIVDVLLIFVSGFLLYIQNHILFITALIPIAAYSSVTYLFHDILYKRNKLVLESHSLLTSYLFQTIKGAENISSLGAKKFVNYITNQKLNKFLSNTLKLDSSVNMSIFLNRAIQSAFGIVVLWIGTEQILSDKMSLGQLLTFTSLLTYFVGAIERITNLQPDIQKAAIASQRYFEVLDHKAEEINQGYLLQHEIKEILIKDLNFKYDLGENILQNVSIQLSSGQTVALIGESGSGKSTLAKLMVKLYACGDNQIFINNLSICSIDTESLRKKILYVSQNNFFLKGTIKENLCLGKEFSYEELNEACKLACIDTTIESLPYKYNYILSEDASNLSVGQKQRLSIARALLHKPEVIIFDEITSNIDKENTDKIMENLRSYNGIKLFITHKAGDLDYFDNVYIIENKTIYLHERRAMMS